MPARVTFLIGRAGSGKTRTIHQRIGEQIRAGSRPVLLVPEQFTYETEQELSAHMDGGLLGVSVLSFTTLSRRVMEQTGVRNAFLSPVGRRMLLRRAAREQREQLRFFAGVSQRPGFAQTLEELFSLCRRFSITPQALGEAARSVGEGTLLGDKLADLALLYQSQQSALREGYLEEEDALDLLSSRLSQSSYADRDVYLDGFDLLTVQLYSAIGALMEHCRSLTVSICMDPGENAADADVFLPEQRAYRRLLDMAGERGCPVRRIALEHTRGGAPALCYLERNLYRQDAAPFLGDCSAIRVFAASGPAAEAEALAAAVQEAARAGVRYRDMAVIAADLDRYALPVRRAFARAKIPLFLDAGRPISGHPVAVLAARALAFAGQNWPLSPFLDLIKTGFCGLKDEEAETLENYLLATGVRGGMLRRPFSRGQEQARAAAELARIKVMEPLERLHEGLRGDTALDKTKALYDYFLELNVAQQLMERVEALRAQGRYDQALENAQVYDLLMELLEQLSGVLGKAHTPMDRYLSLFEEGLEAYEAGVIPTMADQVLLGSISRTRSRAVEALFVVGCADGLLPRYYYDDSVIDDGELKTLSRLGLTVWGGTDIRSQNDRLEIYRALSRPTQSLYLSYSLSLDGQEQAPSPVITRILDRFPNVRIQSDIGADLSPSLYAAAGLHPLVRGLRTLIDSGAVTRPVEQAYALAAQTPSLAQGLPAVEQALFFDPTENLLSPELARGMCRGYISASRLEQYNACPFEHLLQYGLRVQPREEYRERPVDEGSFYHAALDALLKRIQGAGLEFSALNETDVAELVDEIVPPILEEHNGGFLRSNARAQARAAQMVRTLKNSAAAMVRQIGLGGYRPVAAEAAFGPGQPLPALALGPEAALVGRIDRVDRCGSGADALLRVVDYKRGGAGFDFCELYGGIKLQLPLYLSAVTGRNGVRPGGMYYLHIHDAKVAEGEPEEKLFSQYRMAGLTLNTPQALAAGDSGAAGGPRGSAVLPAGVAAQHEMELITAFARKKAEQTVSAIRSGEAPVRPYRYGKKTACAFCENRSVCFFDQTLPACRYRELSALKQEEFMARLEGGEKQ